MTATEQRAAIKRIARSISNLDGDELEALADRMLEAGEVEGDVYRTDGATVTDDLELAIRSILDPPIEWYDTATGTFLLADDSQAGGV